MKSTITHWAIIIAAVATVVWVARPPSSEKLVKQDRRAITETLGACTITAVTPPTGPFHLIDRDTRHYRVERAANGETYWVESYILLFDLTPNYRYYQKILGTEEYRRVRQ